MMLKTNILNFLKDQSETELLIKTVTMTEDLHLMKSAITENVDLLLGSSTANLFNMEYEGLLLFDHTTNNVLGVFQPLHDWMLKTVISDLNPKDILSMADIQTNLHLVLQSEFQSILDNLDPDFSSILNTTKRELQEQAQEYIDEMVMPEYDLPDPTQFYDTLSMTDIVKVLQDVSEYAYETVMSFFKNNSAFFNQYLNTAYMRQYVKDTLDGKAISDLERARMKVKELFADTESRKSFQISFKNPSGELVKISVKNGKKQFIYYPYFAIYAIEYRKKKLYEQDEKTVDEWRNTQDLWLDYFSTTGLFSKKSMEAFKPVRNRYFPWQSESSIWEMFPMNLLQDFAFMSKLIRWDVLPSILCDQCLKTKDDIKEFLKAYIKEHNSGMNHIGPDDPIIKQICRMITDYDKSIIQTLLRLKVYTFIPYIDQTTIRDPEVIDLLKEWMLTHPSSRFSFSPKQVLDNPKLIEMLESLPENTWYLYRLIDWRSSLTKEGLTEDDWENIEKTLEDTVHQEQMACRLCQQLNTILDFKHVTRISLDGYLQIISSLHNYAINEKTFAKIPKSILYDQKFLNVIFKKTMLLPDIFLDDFLNESLKFGWNKAESLFSYYKELRPDNFFFRRPGFRFDDFILLFEENPKRILSYIAKSDEEEEKILEFLEKHETEFETEENNWDKMGHVVFDKFDVSILAPFLEKHPVFYKWMTRNIIHNIEYLKDASEHMSILPVLSDNSDLLLDNPTMEDAFINNETFLLKQASYPETSVLDLFSKIYTLKDLYAGKEGLLYTDPEFLLKLLQIDTFVLDTLHDNHPIWKNESFAKEAIKLNPELFSRFSKRIQKAIQ